MIDAWLQAIVLGIVQGVTEFLPVSSDGHLVALPYILSWCQPTLAFTVALHIGTLIGVVLYFAGDLWFLGTRSLGIGAEDPSEPRRARRTVALLVVGTIPAAIAGFLLEDFFSGVFEEPRVAVAGFLVTAAILWGAERIRRRRVLTARADAAAVTEELDPRDVAADEDVGRDESTVSWLDAIAIGTAQSLALFPGLSRSGITIATGMARGLTREGAARFSFLLSIPAVAGATILEVPQLSGELGGFTLAQAVAGIVAAGLTGFLAIRYLLRLVQTDDLTGFARYLLFAAALVTVGSIWIGTPDATGCP